MSVVLIPQETVFAILAAAIVMPIAVTVSNLFHQPITSISSIYTFQIRCVDQSAEPYQIKTPAATV